MTFKDRGDREEKNREREKEMQEKGRHIDQRDEKYGLDTVDKRDEEKYKDR